MHRSIFAALATTLVLAGCGGSASPRRHPLPAAPASATRGTGTAPCNPAPGTGTMGACVSPGPPAALPPTAAGARLIPDVSEFQGCALRSEAIIRVYEAGTNREDSRAACHFRELKRLGAWSAAYFFARPPGFDHAPSCVAQAKTAVSIAARLGARGPVVDDAEVPLPPGFVRCVKTEIERLGWPEVEYTCPGCGDERVEPVWIASYPTRPPGTWVAHQFADNFNCRGVVGDCSVNEGILSIHRVKPSPKPKPLTKRQARAKLAQVNRLLGPYDHRRNPHGHNCQHPPYKHAYPSARFNGACAQWAREVRALR